MGWWLYPEQPKLTADTAFEKQEANHRAGGSKCEPSAIRRLGDRKRVDRADRCSEATEQDREQTNTIIEARRSADAANASVITAYEQARVAAIGAPLGFITMIAAISAAIYAREAARHTDRGANAATTGNDISRKEFRAAYRPTLEIEATGPLIRNSGNFKFDHDVMVALHFMGTIKNVSERRAILVEYCVQAEGRPDSVRHERIYRVLKPGEITYFRDDDRIHGAEQAHLMSDPIPFTSAPLHQILVPAGENVQLIRAPVISGYVDFIDEIDVRRRQSFAFAQSRLWNMGVMPTYGGEQRNHVRELNEDV